MPKTHICPTCFCYMLDYLTVYKKCVSCGFTRRNENIVSITRDELLKGRDQNYPNDFTEEISDNIDKLLIIMNKIRNAYGQSMIITSGWRPASLNAKVSGAAAHSNHIMGEACDVNDADGSLWTWVLNNLDLMQDLGVYFENPNWTRMSSGGGWVHFQIVKPASGHRIFVPSSAPAINPSFWNGEYDVKYNS